MGMKYNKLRKILNEGKTSVCTRIWSSNASFTELLGDYKFDYVEFLAEYSPFSQMELQNICRAAELNEMGSLIKVDFQNRGYVAQKAVASGFHGILFTDHRTPDEVKESVRMMKPETPELGGMFGFPNNRFIGCQGYVPQLENAKRIDDVVLAFMIEKKQAMDNIEEICAIPGVDMVQFGPSDYSMSCGKNKSDFTEEYMAAERKMIEVALRNGVQPRCEINSSDEAQYYIDLGVRHFCVGDQLVILKNFWKKQGDLMAEICKDL